MSQIGTPEWHPVYVGRKKRQLPSEPLLHWRVLFPHTATDVPGGLFERGPHVVKPDGQAGPQ